MYLINKRYMNKDMYLFNILNDANQKVDNIYLSVY